MIPPDYRRLNNFPPHIPNLENYSSIQFQILTSKLENYCFGWLQVLILNLEPSWLKLPNCVVAPNARFLGSESCYPFRSCGVVLVSDAFSHAESRQQYILQWASVYEMENAIQHHVLKPFTLQTQLFNQILLIGWHSSNTSMRFWPNTTISKLRCCWVGSNWPSTW